MMRKRGWHQAEFARQVGVQPQAVGPVIKSEQLSERVLYRYLKPFGLSVDAFLAGQVLTAMSPPAPQQAPPPLPSYPDPIKQASDMDQDIIRLINSMDESDKRVVRAYIHGVLQKR